jgi:hypothetical protein
VATERSTGKPPKDQSRFIGNLTNDVFGRLQLRCEWHRRHRPSNMATRDLTLSANFETERCGYSW